VLPIRKLANQPFSSAHWVDKTPNLDIVRSADILYRIWPEAKFIYMKRRGIENVMSRLR